jgi:phage baseplate assembly protein W
MTQEFVGTGWAFPLHTDATGAIALATDHEKIEQAMRLVLGTAPGERPMRPVFGCGIHDLVFAPADASTAGLIAHEVRLSLTRWEPRIDVLDVDVAVDAERPGLMYVDVRYSIKKSNDPRNLVFPFYTIPAEAEVG